MLQKNLYIIAGCNGAGKSTIAFSLLPELLECKEYVNADEIARGLSPFQPETVAIEAGRIMLNRIDNLLKENVTFAIETTLSARSYSNLILKAKNSGYNVILLFLWLNSNKLAIKRVQERIKKGGHGIPIDIIKRRYHAGIQNLIKIYIPLCDFWLIFDNSNIPGTVIAHGIKEKKTTVLQKVIFENIINHDSKND